MAAGYFICLALSVALGDGVGRPEAFLRVIRSLGVVALGAAIVRGGWFPEGAARARLHRWLVLGPVVVSYLELRAILRAARHGSVDAALYAFDLRVFGFEPALAWNDAVSPISVEWFSVFYFSYFIVVAAHVVPALAAGRDTDVFERLSLGLLVVYCVGQLTYVLVPAYGPVQYLEHAFTRDLVGGPFWSLVEHTVSVAGAQKDVFPSLHTAAPTYLAAFAFIYRKREHHRWSWIPTAVIASQILPATLFLRWHYLVDVVAGLGLAGVALLASTLGVAYLRKRRVAANLPPPFDSVGIQSGQRGARVELELERRHPDRRRSDAVTEDLGPTTPPRAG